MRKIAAIILALVMVCGLTACGKGDTQSAKSEPSDQSEMSSAENGTASFKYHQMLESDNSKYYYEANVVEEFVEDEVTEEGLKGEARDGKGNYVLLTGEEKLDIRDIETKNAFYSVYDSDKEYSRDENDASDEGEEDAMELIYAKSDQMEMDGKTYDYDEYQGKYEFEGYTEDEQVVVEDYVLIRRYVMNEKGELHAIIELQEKIGENGKKNTPIYRKTEKITKFQEGQFPKNVFKIPKDYEETAAFPEEEVLLEE